MALQGTLKDFGIADILQLIGQQQKTGTLLLKGKEQEIKVFFRNGTIVRTESTTRKKKDLIGAMLVHAELITEQQLESALEMQRRTLRRLGDVLVSSGYITGEHFQEMMQLQVEETLYKLFAWKTGTYEFKQEEFDSDVESIRPLRAESVLMEGFRRVDEWPTIRKVISDDGMTFERLRPLPPPTAKEDDVDAAFDDAFSEEKKDENKGEFKSVGASERRVYEAIAPGRDVRKLVGLSCLGEFETCKALLNLINLEYIRPTSAAKRSATPSKGNLLRQLGGAMGRVAITMVLLVVLGFLASRLHVDALDLGGASAPTSTYADPAAQRFIARTQQARITAALAVFRLEKGEFPERLEALVSAGLLRQEDLRYPWRDEYYYRRLAAGQFILLPPLR